MLIGLIVKSIVVIAIAIVPLAVARRASAASRHLLLTALFVTLALLPLLGLIVPENRVEVAWVPPVTDVAPEASLEAAPARAAPVEMAATPRAPIGWRRSLQATFIVGIVVGVMSMAVGLLRLRRLRLSGRSWTSPLLDALRRDAMIRRDLRVLLCPDLSVPVTYGIVRPTILLPLSSREWSDAERIAALIHEIEHVRRGDWIVQLFARAIAIAYWPNVLVWFALRRLALEAERAADDAVVRKSERPSSYAEQLVALARRIRGFGLPALAMATPSNLAQRVEAILDSTRRRGGRSVRQSLAALFAVVFVALMVAPLQLAGAGAGTSYDQAVRDGVAGGVEDGVTGGVEDGVVEGVERPFGIALIEAAGDGRLEHLRQLLDSGVSPNVVAPGDGTPLIAAARAGHEDIVRLLIARGADVNAQVWADGSPRNPQGELRTPLIMARRGGHVRVVEILLQSGAKQ